MDDVFINTTFSSVWLHIKSYSFYKKYLKRGSEIIHTSWQNVKISFSLKLMNIVFNSDKKECNCNAFWNILLNLNKLHILSQDGRTALIHAATYASEPVVASILKAKADPFVVAGVSILKDHEFILIGIWFHWSSYKAWGPDGGYGFRIPRENQVCSRIP